MLFYYILFIFWNSIQNSRNCNLYDFELGFQIISLFLSQLSKMCIIRSCNNTISVILSFIKKKKIRNILNNGFGKGCVDSFSSNWIYLSLYSLKNILYFTSRSNQIDKLKFYLKLQSTEIKYLSRRNFFRHNIMG